MIQDIGVEQLKNEYHPKPPKDESRIMIFDAGKLLCRINEEMQIAYPKYGEWRKNKADEGTLIYLFSIGEDTYYLLSSSQKTEIEGYAYEKMFVCAEHFLSVSGLRESVPIICIPGMKTIIFAENVVRNS